MSGSQSYNVNLNINANTQSAQSQLQNLQKQLMQIANMKVNIQGTDALASNITEASQAALKLSSILNASTNMQTGNLDYIKFSNALKKGNIDIVKYGQTLQELGPAGQKAFAGLAQTIAKSEIPIKRTSQLTQKMWDGLKRTAGWQLQSSLIHGIVGGVQKAVGYAKDLNKSLTDIRIVTGQSSDQMAKFAQYANKAAKQLNTTTTEYTKASLIYYQQGLSEADVKARTETTIKMANVTGTTAQKVSDQMTAIWNNYDNGTKSLTHYADVMTALGAATASSTDEIAQGLQKFAAISNTVGLSYEYAASALATITAESRESADVVGNALKTLFSRIQGLQLGETLDDGTTLNKYSTALAKVGISIKDQAGGLKDMDDILNEMGEKWDTLARDEKMALAQTVAGVRQYTQLMTLMENWDDFKQNLNTANTSKGTLDSQAAIYADSWEAASKKVRTSFEGLWDKLINSDGFITALNLLSGFVDILGKLVDGMGGATGVFASFAGVMTKMFSPQIAQGLSNFGYGIKMMMPGVQQAYKKEREEQLEKFQASFKSGHMDSMGSHESSTYASIVGRQVNEAQRYLPIQDQLEADQKFMYEHYSKLIEENEARQVENSQQLDQSERNIGGIFDKIYDGKRASKITDENYGLNANYKSVDQNGKVTDSGKSRRDFFSEKAARHEARMSAAQNLTNVDVDSAEFKEFLDMFSDRNQGKLKKSVLGWKKEGLSTESILGKLREKVGTINTGSMNRAASSMVLTDEEQGDIPSGEEQSQYKENFAEYGKEQANKQGLERKGQEMKKQGEKLDEERTGVSTPQKSQDTAKKMVNLASGLTSTVAAISAMEGLSTQIKAIGDGSADATAVLGSLVSVASNGLMAFSSLSSVMGGPWAAALMAALALTTMLIKTVDKNNISEKERIKTLQQSDAEIANAAQSTKQLVETYETQNKNYLDSVEKIKTSSKPEEVVNDIFYANQQALKLIQDYGLTEDQYKKNHAGLIEIDEQVLEDKVTAAEKANQDMERTSALSNLTTQRELAEIDINNLLDDTGYTTYNGSQVTTRLFGTNKDSDTYVSAAEAWSFDELMSIYGTEEWDKAKEKAKALGKKTSFEKMEEQILAYQEANNLLDLAMRNNVDALLRNQEYTLDGAETFAALGYEDYGKKYNETYENGQFSGTNFNSSNLTDAHKNRIKEYLESQGYTGVEDIEFDGEDISKFTFKHDEGEGSANVEAVRKWDAEQVAADGVESTFDASMGVLQSIYENRGADVAPGLMSLLTGDDFANATTKEMEAAKNAVGDIGQQVFDRIDQLKASGKHTGTDADIADIIQKEFGISVNEFKELFNIDPGTNLGSWFTAFKNVTSSAQHLISGEPLLQQWFEGTGEYVKTGSSDIAQNLTQNTLTQLYNSFKRASALGGEDVAKDMLGSITDVLKDSGLNDDEWDAAIQGLLAIDWSDSMSSAGAAAAVISNLGGTLDMTSGAWQNFANAMEAAAGSIPDFSEVIGQLTDLAAAIQGLGKGDLIDAAVVEQLIAMGGPEIAKLFSKHHSGDYTFIGDDTSGMKDMIWDEMNETKAEAGVVEEKYKDYIEGDGKNLKSNNDISDDDFSKVAGPYGSHWYEDNHAMALANLAGYSNEQVTNILDTYTSANTNLSLWQKDSGVTLSNGDRVRINKEGKYESQDANGNWSEVTDQGKLADYAAYHQADQTEFDTAKGIRDTMLNSIHSLDEISGEWTQEEIEQAVSTADSAADVFDRINKGQEGFTDEDGTLSEGVLKGLQALPATSEQSTLAIDKLVEAEANLAKENNATNQAIYDQALYNAELQTSIDAIAAARGLDAEALRAEATALQEVVGAMPAEEVAKMAAEKMELAEDTSTLKSEYQELSKALTDVNKKGTALQKMKKLMADILDVGVGELSDEMVEAAHASGLLEDVAEGDTKALGELRKAQSLATAATEQFGISQETVNEIIAKDGLAGLEAYVATLNGGMGQDLVDNWNTIVDGMSTMDWSEILASNEMQSAINGVLSSLTGLKNGTSQSLADITSAALGQGFMPQLTPIESPGEGGSITVPAGGVVWADGGKEGTGTYHSNVTSEDVAIPASEGTTYYGVKFVPITGGAPSGGGGGGGGGPKKVANKRKSQTVKRYRRADNQRSLAQSAKKSASTQKDYLYGESKIAQMEKINKLAEKEARITSDRIKESRKYLVEDRENLIKYMQKYGYEAEFDSDGFLSNYEDAWTQIHDKIAKLYEDNELTADEQKLEEDYKIELEELEGALEDYENSLKELQADIEAYEESLYEMYDNKVEQMQHKVEFKIELNEDDLSYLDFWIEALGDSLYNALESLQTMGQKTNVLFDGINTYKQGIEDIYALSDDPLHTWATGGLDEVLTQDQVDALRENRDGLMDYMKQLLELRSSIQDKVLETFDKWQEKLNNTMSTIEHYSSVLEHFKNIIDIVGKDALGLSDNFMSNLQQNAVDQSMDIIDASKSHYDSLVSQNATAQAELEAARARGDQASIEHWENVVQQTTSEMQSAQDALLSSLESTLTMITEQFEAAMTQAVEAFNDAIYAHGGLQGLSDDYAFIREQADLMAEDYDKIYQLSKLNRNINKIMNDSSVIAGKQKMKTLQQEINELQASGVELSKYDLEYLQAKYELRLAEIELENARNNKDTVRLSRDSEGNWSYIYTASTEKVDEAQQKYEDALYAMQNLSYEYMDEMSNAMMQTSLKMMEEIQALRIQDFDSYDAYAAEIERIQNKYSEVLANQENELNKSMSNNEELYNKDWQSYSTATGYKISANEDWADNYYETTLGMLLGSQDSASSFTDIIGGLSTTLLNDLGVSATTYFANMETAMNKYGTSIAGFGNQVTSTVSQISTQSKTAAQDMKTMAADMNKAFTDITTYVSGWQEEFSQTISDMLTEIGTLVQGINDAIQRSAELAGGKSGAEDLIGSEEAAKLLNNHETYDFGEWSYEDGQLKVNGEATTFVEENAKLINQINEMMVKYTSAETGSEARAEAAAILEELFKKYHAFKDIVGRVYDPTNLGALDLETPSYSSFDTGGYTGEWGDSGKFAMLHEKELILNQDDTKNFLDALNISKDVINSMIELNAKQSSMGFGDLVPATFKDTLQSLEQQVSITAEFPNATDHNEIEEAFSNLINQASQYAHRYKD